MRVISMVPSWTEMLIESGVNVVGRTRFCIHPKSVVKSIPIVGGTKDIKWDQVSLLKADLLILDREENPKSMAEDSPIPYFDTHIKSVLDVAPEVSAMANILGAPRLREMALSWEVVGKASAPIGALKDIPGVLEWVKPPHESVSSILYMIWKNPWMAAAPSTFIGSVFKKLGYSSALIPFNEPYPIVKLDSFDPMKTLLLFSTEPFPFSKKKDDLLNLPFSTAIIDGEAYSWFGVRTLRFLEKHLVRP